jgi:endonuclease III
MAKKTTRHGREGEKAQGRREGPREGCAQGRQSRQGGKAEVRQGAGRGRCAGCTWRDPALDTGRSDGSPSGAFSRSTRAPKGELQHVNPFTLLVAVVLSAQATDAGVNKATRRLFAEAATPEAMVALGEDKVREHIKTIGLYRNKAKNVVALSERLIAEHGGAVPPSRTALELLPGVGRKTANVVLNTAFGEPTIAVDTHLFRVGNRTRLAPGKTPLAVELGLSKNA